MPGCRSSVVWAGVCLALQLGCGSLSAARPQLDLTGAWGFYPDVGDSALEGVTVKPGRIVVPGAWQAQGYGRPGGAIPASLLDARASPADHLRHNLTARCLYARVVEVPASWKGRRVFLVVRRVYACADVSVNGKRIGDWEGFCSPFEFDVTDAITLGARNQIVIGVDNRPHPGRDTYGTANWVGNWGGLGGAVYLEARSPDWLDDVFAMPRITEAQVQLRVTVRTARPDWPATLAIQAEVAPWHATGRSIAPTGRARRPVPPGGAGEMTFDLPVAMTSPRLWSPEDPFLYVATVRLVSGGQALDERQVRFGMRQITAQGRKLFLNGRPLYLCGYGDDATEPITGMLPADKGLYRKRLALMRSLGFNYVRHHSAVPHDEYLEAADEVGLLVQPEAGMAYTKFWPSGHPLFEKEWPHIIRAFRNHPCIWAWCTGNELFLRELPEREAGRGSGFTRQDALALMERAYRQAKALDPTRLVHASDGGTPQEFTDVFSSGPSDKLDPKPRLLHEYGAYTCSLPDLSLIPRLNGVIRPLTYERAERYVRQRGLGQVYPRLYQSSLRMRADAQKHYMEAAKASGDNNGYSFWLGVDFPDSPEGCWDEGVLNQLWEPKPCLTNNLPDFTGSTVLLTTAGLDARSFYSGETKRVGLRLWHYGARPIQKARLAWRLREGDKTLKSGETSGISCGPGETESLGEAVLDGLSAARPQYVTLQVELRQAGRLMTRNAWEFYAYPRVGRSEALPGVYSEAGPVPGAVEMKADAPIPEDLRLLITRRLKRDRHAAFLGRGNAAVLLLGAGGFKETRAGYFLNQNGGAFGGIIEDHPVFASIPHEGRLHPGLYQLIAGGGMLDAESMPAALRDGSVVWGLRLTAWISPVKDLQRVTLFSDVVTDTRLHLVLCDLDLLADKPECRYVLAKTLDYLLAGQPSRLTRQCAAADVEKLLH